VNLMLFPWRPNVKLPLRWIVALVVWAPSLTFIAADAHAQTPARPWSVEASVGWDVGLTGDFLSASIGTLNGVPVVFQSQPFDDVYGNGLMWQFGGGYRLDEWNEVRAHVGYQRVGADVAELGTAGAFDLVATFDDYRAWNIEGGYRRYFPTNRNRLRPYAGATLGVAIISEIDAVFASPQAGLERYATDFYDGTAAFTFGVNGGVLYSLNERFDLKGQLDLRYNSGLSAIDATLGTGLEDVNDKSSRWTLPITFGVRVKF
jgi:hypothetical protein